MIANDKTPAAVSPGRRRARRLRIAGISILLLGVAGAIAAYWLGTRSPDLSGDPSMAGFDKPEERQMALLYGRQGELIEQWTNDLKQPGTQAVIIVAVSVLLAGGCFYFARLSDFDDENG